MTVGSKNIRLVDVALKANVSQGTASNVFNKPDQVSEDTKRRVLRAAEELGYRGPDPAGRLLRAGKTNNIGVLISNPLSYFVTDPVARAFVSGLASECDERGLSVTLISAQDEARAAQAIRSALVDGFIVHCLEDDAHLVQLAMTRNLPMAVVDAQIVENTPHITVDDRAGARMAIEHVVSLGHTKIGILSLNLRGDQKIGPPDLERLSGISFEVTRKRIAGYQDALEAAGLSLQPHMIYECDNDRTQAAEGTAYLLAQDDPPTAIVTMSDMLARGVLDHARRAGIFVPGRLSVVGYDDMPDAALTNPPLTTINQPSVLKGRRAAQAVFTADREAWNEVLPVELIVRKSTAPPSSA